MHFEICHGNFHCKRQENIVIDKLHVENAPSWLADVRGSNHCPTFSL